MSNYTNNLFKPSDKNNAWVHLFDYVPQKSRVLDVGCSSGNFGDVLIHEKQCEVVGIDIDQPDIAKAKKKLTAAHVRNIERESINDLGKFDVVIFADVLEHLMDPVAALNKVKKQLKKGGRIVFSIPNMAHMYVRLQLLEGFFEYSPIGVLDRTHLHYYDEVEVKHIFAEASLAIREVHPHTIDYPMIRLRERFARVGLAIADEKKLQAVIKKTKGFVWQFVGFATPEADKQQIQRPIHYAMPPEELNTALDERTQELNAAKTQIQELHAKQARMTEFYNNPVKGLIMRFIRRVRVRRQERSKRNKAEE